MQHQVGFRWAKCRRSHDVGAEPVPVAPAAPETREGQPWNMRLGDRKRPELPQLQRRRCKSLEINRD